MDLPEADDLDEDLAAVLRSWATLPAPIRRAILAMIESVEKEK